MWETQYLRRGRFRYLKDRRFIWCWKKGNKLQVEEDSQEIEINWVKENQKYAWRIYYWTSCFVKVRKNRTNLDNNKRWQQTQDWRPGRETAIYKEIIQDGVHGFSTSMRREQEIHLWNWHSVSLQLTWQKHDIPAKTAVEISITPVREKTWGPTSCSLC